MIVASEDDIAYFVINGDINRQEVYRRGMRDHEHVVYRKSNSNSWYQIVRFDESSYYDVPYYGIIPPDAWITQ